MSSSNSEINFTDKTIRADREHQCLKVKPYHKSTDRNSLLLFAICHPKHLKENLPVGQFLLLKRNSSSKNDFLEEAATLSHKIRLRGYSKKSIHKALKRAKHINRVSLLEYNKKPTQEENFVFVSTFTNLSNQIMKIIEKNWKVLEEGNPSRERQHISPLAFCELCILRGKYTMEMRCPNQTAATTIVLLGFPSPPPLHILQFPVFLMIYLLTVIENTIIIIVVRSSHLIQSPMYLLISYLSCLEILYINITVPKMLENILSACKSISLPACIIQLYLFLTMACSECFLLAVMAYDRYLAICHPLHYTMMMTIKRCSLLTIGCCVGGLMASTFSSILISQLDFCGPNVIDHYFCDISPLLHLSCTDVSVIEVVDFIAACVVLVSPLLVTMVSYGYIIAAVLRIPSAAGQKKTFSTCASHLIVVTMFFGTGIFTYARPRAIKSFELNKLVSAMYTIVTPVINPLIYTLRNKEFKEVLGRTITQRHAQTFCGL
ncbi:olfactory receptor 6B1-like [Ambystoma mexicanum]|uniref:olfactory receptor 6B1-like n=1 Tax=Ambystoma mexicanum TaxID=8296 RepID=UPI0037E978F7